MKTAGEVSQIVSTDEAASLLPFTAHRLQLGNDLWTMPHGVGDDPFSDLRTRVVVERSGGSLAGKRILDLGCLEGGYTAAFAQIGAKEVVGIEARELSFRRCLYLRQVLGLENTVFHKGDVKGATRDWLGEFDVVFAAGILYHLDDPYLFLRNVAELTSDFVLIDTHVAGETSWGHGCSERIFEREFGSIKYRGREAPEFPADTSREKVADLLWSAYSNSISFWLTEESLVDMLLRLGFDYISKVYVPRGYRCQENCGSPCRILLVAKKGCDLAAARPGISS